MRAGFYECDITPPLGGFLWGHYAKVFANTVYDRLYAKALVVEDGGELAAIVEVDACSVPADMHDFVTKRVFEYTGITPDRVCLSCNHSHAGASVGGAPELRVEPDTAYASVAYRLTADAIILAYERMEEVELSFGVKSVEGITFCRNFELNDGTLITHGRGKDIKRALDEPDNDLSVVMFEKAGKPIGALINYSCHQCSMGALYKNAPGYSGDYASILSNRLKEHYGHDFVSLFALGAAGNLNNTNPDISVPTDFERTGKEAYICIGNALADAVLSMEGKLTPIPGGVKVAKKILEIPRRTVTDYDLKLACQQLYGNKPARVQNLLHYMGANEETSTKLAVQVIQIGDLGIFCMPGELYSAFGMRIKKESPFNRNIVVENCNYYTGYIPNADCFGENSQIYEVSLCFHSNLIPEAGTILTDAILELAKEL